MYIYSRIPVFACSKTPSKQFKTTQRQFKTAQTRFQTHTKRFQKVSLKRLS